MTIPAQSINELFKLYNDFANDCSSFVDSLSK